MGYGDYDTLVMEEGGFKVELSNRGGKPKFNPNPQNLEKKLVECKYPGCNVTTRTIFGLCKKHNTYGGRKKILHIKDWFGRIIPPGLRREQCLIDILPHYTITEMLVKWMGDEEGKKKVMDDFMDDVLNNIVSNVPDATTLQKNINGEIEDAMTPGDLVEMTRRLVDKHFKKEEYDGVKLPGGSFRGKSLDDIPIRIVAATLIIAYACEESNRGDAWFCKINNRASTFGNAYMPSVYYFLRRHTKATKQQARMCLKG